MLGLLAVWTSFLEFLGFHGGSREAPSALDRAVSVIRFIAVVLIHLCAWRNSLWHAGHTQGLLKFLDLLKFLKCSTEERGACVPVIAKTPPALPASLPYLPSPHSSIFVVLYECRRAQITSASACASSSGGGGEIGTRQVCRKNAPDA